MSKCQVFLLVVISVMIGVAHCAKWPRPYPPRYSSEESNSRSLSSEEYHGGALPPLALGGVPLPSPVHTNSVQIQAYTPRPNPLATTRFAELIKGNQVLIDNSMGANRHLAYVSKARQIPLPDGLGEMYYVKGYFTNELGYRNKCTFYMFAKDDHSQILDSRCSY